jgi:hypothetical protein
LLTEKDIEADDDDEVPATPTKKAKTSVKKEPSQEASDVADNGTDGLGLNGGFFDNAMGPQ